MTLFLLLLVALETAAFVFAVFFVFSDTAAEDLDRITTVSLFRSQATKCGHLQRSRMIAAYKNDTVSMQKFSNTIVNVASVIEAQNFGLYHAVQGLMRDHLQATLFSVQTPYYQGWHEENMTYFAAVQDFVRRAKISVNCTPEELIDPNYDVALISDQKAEVAYV